MPWAATLTLAGLAVGAGVAGGMGAFGGASGAVPKGRTYVAANAVATESSTAITTTTTTTTTTTAPAPTMALPACVPSELSVHGGRQPIGFATGAQVYILVTNTGAAPCVLSGVPSVTLSTAAGTPLPITDMPPTSNADQAAVVAPGASASLLAAWDNWCGTPPGPLDVEITLAGTTTRVTGWLNGPPMYDYVPGCVNATRGSTLGVSTGFHSLP